MATVLDTRMTPNILALITRLGVSSTLSSEDGTYDPTTGARADDVTVTTVTATPVSPSKDWEDVSGITYVRGDIAVTPTIGMLFTQNGVAYTVMRVVTYRPGTTIAAYALGVKQ